MPKPDDYQITLINDTADFFGVEYSDKKGNHTMNYPPRPANESDQMKYAHLCIKSGQPVVEEQEPDDVWTDPAPEPEVPTAPEPEPEPEVKPEPFVPGPLDGGSEPPTI